MLADMLRDVMSLMGIKANQWKYSLVLPSDTHATIRFKWQTHFYRLTIERVDSL